MYDLTSAISALIDIGYRQSDALTKIDNLIKMYGIDRAMAAVTEMENDFYLISMMKNPTMKRISR